MTKSEMVDGIAKSADITKKAAAAALTGVNPRNPSEKIKIPAMKIPTFKAGKALKEAVR